MSNECKIVYLFFPQKYYNNPFYGSLVNKQAFFKRDSCGQGDSEIIVLHIQNDE